MQRDLRADARPDFTVAFHEAKVTLFGTTIALGLHTIAIKANAATMLAQLRPQLATASRRKKGVRFKLQHVDLEETCSSWPAPAAATAPTSSAP